MLSADVHINAVQRKKLLLDLAEPVQLQFLLLLLCRVMVVLLLLQLNLVQVASNKADPAAAAGVIVVVCLQEGFAMGVQQACRQWGTSCTRQQTHDNSR